MERVKHSHKTKVRDGVKEEMRMAGVSEEDAEGDGSRGCGNYEREEPRDKGLFLYVLPLYFIQACCS